MILGVMKKLINFIKPPLTSQITPYTADNLKNPSEEPKIPLNYLKLYSKIASTSS